MRPTIFSRTLVQHYPAATLWGDMCMIAIANGHRDTRDTIMAMFDEITDLAPIGGVELSGTMSDDHRLRLADAVRESGYGEIFNQFSTIYADDGCSDRAELFRTVAVLVDYGAD